ncbi:Zinc finger C2H2-type [Fusarium oxysporum f. sp. vasinfectum]|nr:Zinc finger C2H2-type [Fusarium oxysporum f. sp. vasinfectum]
MASTFDVPPASLHDKDNQPFPTSNQQAPTSAFDSNQLPTTLSRVDSDSLSPINYLETPDSTSSLSHYQASDFSDLDDDPFFGADFNADGGAPNFLEQDLNGLDQSFTPGLMPDKDVDSGTYPLTPEQTASVHATPPQGDLSYAIKGSAPSELPNCISPQEIQKRFNPHPINTQTSELTPSHSSSCRSSEDGLAPGVATMTSPRVTVSMWGNHDETPVHTSVERSFEDSPTTVRGGFESAGDLISSGDNPSARDSTGRWQQNPLTGQSGLDPNNRPSNEVPSINELATRRDADERKELVGDWLADKMNDLSVRPDDNSRDQINELDSQRDDPHEHMIPFGRETENKFIPGQTYYRDQGEMSQQDRDIIAANRNWADAPMFPSISRGVPGRNQPESSAAAMERFERMYRDTDSILSRAATWGTRRRSLPSVFDLDMADGTSGGILKKLSSSRESRSSKPGSLLRDLRGLVRRPSASRLKRTLSSGNDEESLPSSEGRGSQDSKRDSISKRGDSVSHLAPPNRIGSWGKKPMPSINTAIASMGSNIASIGTTHARSGSVSGSGTPGGSITSPKSPFSGLSVKKSIRRPRSKSELPKPTPAGMQTESHPTLVSMWKRFQQHIIDLNPGLATTNTFLVDRIAYHQVQRYKYLLKNKVAHIGLGAACNSGIMCVSRGGSATLLDQNKNVRELDPLSSPNDEDDGSPVEGAINTESFPQDIPMPPTSHLPAEFECRLCFAAKKFMKPSDWTKHVHEDVQPFTCTWDKCPGPKMFKRKADWVRHENEGHRQLEWWTCDVEACHHQCYRRDNFLQHLVREHKYPEPKVKSKAAVKKAGGSEPTWQKVEQCHHETTKKPHDEPCRFCGKTFPTWKKLTVHLAKHMEQISLPVLRLVDAKASELSADTVISPVQDPPPRNILTTPIQTNMPMQYPVGGQHQQIPQATPQIYQNHNQNQMANATHNFPSAHAEMGMHPMNHQSFNAAPMQEMTASSAGYQQNANAFMMPSNGLETYNQMNPLGLQSHGMPMGQMGPMVYDGITDPSSGNGSPFSGQGSMSPYSHSPNLNANTGNGMWGDRRMAGYQ